MPLLPHDRFENLLKLFGEMKNCALDEQHQRRKIYWDAAIKAGDDSATSGEEVDQVIRFTWDQRNKSKPTAF
jgi:hypothetical protein